MVTFIIFKTNDQKISFQKQGKFERSIFFR